MASTPAIPLIDPADSHGFIERIVRRCGERPVKWMLVLWFLLMVFWLMLGFVGFGWDKQPDIAVPPEAVPYASYMPGGNLSSTPIEFDRARLPAFDPALFDPDIHFYQVWAPLPTSDRRLILTLRTSNHVFGWPTPWIGSTSYALWDVTDLSQPFRRWVCEWDFIEPSFDGQGPAYWYWKSVDGTHQRLLWLDYLHLAIVISGLQLIAACVVGVLWAWLAFRQWRRQRLGLCLLCGHNLGPIHSERPCPECGVASPVGFRTLPNRSVLQRVFGGTGSALAVMLPFVFVCWLLSSALTATTESYEPIEDRLAREAVEIQARNASHSGGFMTRETNFGWPVQVLSLWDSMHYQWTSTNGMQVLPANSPPSFWSYDRVVQFSWSTRDGVTRRHVNLQLAGFLATLSATVLISMVLSSIGQAIVSAHHRRKNAASSSQT